MKNQSTEILIVTRSVTLQQGLSALLASLPEISSVKTILDVSNAIPWIESHQPGVALLDMALQANDLRAALEKIHALSPRTQRVLLLDHVKDVRWIPQYAEAILIKGAHPSAVASTVSNLLVSRGEKNEHHNTSK
jgi:DNA-binding NarL/FixJ family response regulator